MTEVVLDVEQRHLEGSFDTTHLFEEPGALEKVSELAAGWFGIHLSGFASRRPS